MVKLLPSDWPQSFFPPLSWPPTADFTRESKRHSEPQRVFTALGINLFNGPHFFWRDHLRFLTMLYSRVGQLWDWSRAASHSIPSLPFLRVLSIFQRRRRWHCGRFSLQDLGLDCTTGTVKAGDEEKSQNCVRCWRQEMTTVNDGFQSAKATMAVKGWASRDSRDPVKTVSLTSSTAIREEVNISFYHIYHI